MSNFSLEEPTDSVFGNVSALCCHLSYGACEDTEKREMISRKLTKLAFSCLLKKRAPSVDYSETLSKDVPLEMFMSIAHRQSLQGLWTPKDFVYTTSLMERYEALATSDQYPWLLDVGKMLLVFYNHNIAMDLYLPKCPESFDSASIEGIPSTFNIFKQNRLRCNLLDSDGSESFMCRMVEARLEQMRNPRSIQWPLVEGLSTRWSADSECRKDVSFSSRPPKSGSNSSSPFTDEGFSSPSNHELLRAPFDWTSVSLDSNNPRREWMTVRDVDPFDDESIFENPKRIRRLRKSLLISPCNLTKVDPVQLTVSIKALLTGIASDIFPLVGGKFATKAGLYTDDKPPNLMFCMCKPLLRAGEIFASMNEQKGDYPCSTSSSMNSVIKQYLTNYQAMVLSIPDDTSFSKLLLQVLPFTDQLNYLNNLMKEVLQSASVGDDFGLNGWRLLQKLFTDLRRNGDPNLDKLTSGIFLDCCYVYFRFIDEWIFEGKWHPDLFFHQTMTTEEVVDRYCWLRLFSFSLNNAPGFLPAKSIFECGRTVHLARNMLMMDDSCFSRESRPQVKLVTNKYELRNVKYSCQFYAHTGDDLRSEVRKVFMNHDNEVILQIALEKTLENTSKYLDSKAAEYEHKTSIQRKNLEIIKEELKRCKHHRNIEKLRSSIHELIQDDHTIFCELRNVIADSSLRHELIERYVDELDRIVRKTVLNNWKNKRRSLELVREKYFADLQKEQWVTPEYESFTSSQSSSHLSHSNDEFSEVDAAPSRLVAHCITPSVVSDPHSTLNSKTSYPDTQTSRNPLSHVSESSPQYQAAPSMGEGEFHEAKRSGAQVFHETPDVIGSTEEVDTDLVSDQKPLQCLDSSHTDEENGPGTPLCCQEADSDDSALLQFIPLVHVEDQSSLKKHDSFDRIMSDYERRVHNGTLKPFAHIMRFKKRETRDGPVLKSQATSGILPVEAESKSFVSYHMKKSIAYPLEAQIKVLNNLMLHKFFVENEFLRHLQRLRDVFFRHNGASAMSLTKLICGTMELCSTDLRTFLVYPKLQNILNLSLQADAELISLKAGITPPDGFEFNDPNVIECLSLTYATDWPLKLILTERAIANYNKVFRFIFSIDRTLLYVTEASQQLKRFSKMFHGPCTQFHLHLHAMLVILNGLKLYTGFYVTDAWEKFHSRLGNVKCSEVLYRVHVKYVKGILHKLMLVKQMSRAQDGIKHVLHYALEYCEVLKHVDWHLFTTDPQYLTMKSKKCDATFRNFKNCVDYTSATLDYFIGQKGLEYLKMLHQSFVLNI